jgi:CheY-like chemotaxis protein
MINRMLSAYDYEVTAVNSSEAALSAFEPGRFDLITTDYELPSMKGDELAAVIRTQAPHQRIIMVTAWGEALYEKSVYLLAVDMARHPLSGIPLTAVRILRVLRNRGYMAK